MLRPTVVHVESREDYFLYLEFNNGEKKIFDVKPYIKGTFYGQLLEKRYFQMVAKNGYSVEWPNGQDICPDSLYYDSKKAE